MPQLRQKSSYRIELRRQCVHSQFQKVHLPRAQSCGKLQPGHKVIVKGLYIAGTPSRINVTSVIDLAPACP